MEIQLRSGWRLRILPRVPRQRSRTRAGCGIHSHADHGGMYGTACLEQSASPNEIDRTREESQAPFPGLCSRIHRSIAKFRDHRDGLA